MEKLTGDQIYQALDSMHKSIESENDPSWSLSEINYQFRWYRKKLTNGDVLGISKSTSSSEHGADNISIEYENAHGYGSVLTSFVSQKGLEGISFVRTPLTFNGELIKFPHTLQIQPISFVGGLKSADRETSFVLREDHLSMLGAEIFQWVEKANKATDSSEILPFPISIAINLGSVSVE